MAPFLGSRAEFSIDIPTIKKSFEVVPFYTGTTLIVGAASLCCMLQGIVWTAEAISAAATVATLGPSILLVIAGAYLLLNSSRNLPRFKADGKMTGWNQTMQHCSKAPHAQILNALINLMSCQNYSLHHLMQRFRVQWS